jgi:hypothetical protein
MAIGMPYTLEYTGLTPLLMLTIVKFACMKGLEQGAIVKTFEGDSTIWGAPPLSCHELSFDEYLRPQTAHKPFPHSLPTLYFRYSKLLLQHWHGLIATKLLPTAIIQ